VKKVGKKKRKERKKERKKLYISNKINPHLFTRLEGGFVHLEQRHSNTYTFFT